MKPLYPTVGSLRISYKGISQLQNPIRSGLRTLPTIAYWMRRFTYPLFKICGITRSSDNHISRNNDNPLVLETFRKAFEKHKDVTGLIVHSDQGSQYTSHAYHDMLPQVGAQISMSRRGNCYDNASIESFFSHLKVEALYPYDRRSIDEAQRRIVE
ncbi:transposase [Paenibacillus sp. GCM10012307]|uniref:Transposase family protein n=1 Tax=Paenibacillus roseus TaxID=2798579 RepID=A0A934IXG1_9BACL|nr:transposase family protein [Paenibacillus roseus]